MPRLEDIKQFVSTLNALGHEPEILAARGENLEAVQPPEQGLSEDIRNLFQDMGTDDGGAELQAALAGGEEFPGAEEEPLDFSSLLESPDAGEEPEKTGDFDFADLSFPDDAAGGGEMPGEEPAEEPPAFDAGDLALPEDFGVEELPEDLAEAPEEAPPAAESFTFDLPPEKGEAIELSDEGLPEAPEAGEEPSAAEPLEEAGESPAGDSVPDEFSLGDFGKEFGISDEEGIPEETGTGPAINIPEGAPEFIAAAQAGEGFSLTDEEFGRLRSSLAGLPLNVKIAVEEIVGEAKGDDEARIELVRALVKGLSARAVATLAGKILGKAIPIPKSYEKRTGAEYEAEKESFAYIFRENILPVLKVTALASAALAILTYTGFQFVYKPIRAGSLFRQGITRIDAGDYRAGNRLFSQAYSLWRDKSWYFRYADKFAEKRQYRLTQEKYEELLAEYDDYIHRKTQIRTERKKDRYFIRGVVGYAEFESRTMENFEKAEKILKRLLDADMYSYPGLLAAGDNYTRWADSDPERFGAKYAEARKAFADLLSRRGDEDEILFRLLEIAIRTDRRDEVLRYKAYFQGRKKAKIDPLRYAELGGYLIDKSMTEDAADILFRSMDTDKNVPEVHYHLARYFAKKEQPRDERRALDNAVFLFGSSGPLDRRRLWRWVDTYGRSGELHYARREFIEAEKALREGLKRYEDGIRKTLLKKDPELGRLYEKLGDIFYYESGDHEEALAQYQKAEDSLVRNPDLFYKKGFIRYGREEHADALREFARTEDFFPSNRNLLFALGNANYERNNFSAAEGYYSYLAGRLEADRRRAGELLPDVRSSDRAIVLNMIKVYNNLGVVLYKLGERTGNRDRASKALVFWTDASELSENLARDPDSRERRDTKNLAYLNMRQILNPLPNYDLQIYHPLPRDLRELFF